MATANSEIKAFGNFIVTNLKELAKFEKRTDIQNMFGSKLNIEPNGRFVMVNGAGAAWGRNKNSSLTNEYNRKSVENLLNEAIRILTTQGVQQNPELRKAIFDGIRGYRWLLGSYRGEHGNSFNNSLDKLDEIQKEFMDKLKNAINKMDQFHLWFATAQPEVKFENYGQSVYLNDNAMLGDGICAGITTKWLARWVASGKSSIMDSSKVNQQQLDFNQEQEREFQKYKIINRTKWIGEIARYGGEAAAEFRVKQDLNNRLANRNLNDPTLNRMQKKGSGMFVAQQEQGYFKKGGDLQEVIQNASKLNANIQKASKLAKTLLDKNDLITDKRRKDENWVKFEKATEEARFLDTAAQRNAGFTGQNQLSNTAVFLERISQQYANAHTLKCTSSVFNQCMYFRDASDFEPEIRAVLLPLVSESEASLNKGERTGYYIGWGADKLDDSDGYRFGNKGINGISTWGSKRISISGGHALGFHITLNNSFLVFDPNYGEFGCVSGEDVIKHFARWFSMYSKDTAINKIKTMKIYQDDLYQQLEREFWANFS
jgi:hypothetical protein